MIRATIETLAILAATAFVLSILIHSPARAECVFAPEIKAHDMAHKGMTFRPYWRHRIEVARLFQA